MKKSSAPQLSVWQRFLPEAVVHEMQSKTKRLVLAPASEFDFAMEERYRGKLDYILFEAQPVVEMAGAIIHAANSYCSEYYSEHGLE